MAVRVVAGNSLSQPQHVGHSQILAENAGNFLTAETRVADLRQRIEQALFRGQQRAPPVDVDAAAFQNKPPAVYHGIEAPQAERPRRPRRNLAIFSPVGILRPTCEAEPRDSHSGARRVPLHKYRAEVARPAAIGRKAKKLHALQVHADSLEDASRLVLMRFRVNQYPHNFAGNDLADNLTIHPGNGSELPRPVRKIMRPPDPSSFMRLPLSGHAVALGAGGWGLGAGRSVLGGGWRGLGNNRPLFIVSHHRFLVAEHAVSSTEPPGPSPQCRVPSPQSPEPNLFFATAPRPGNGG